MMRLLRGYEFRGIATATNGIDWNSLIEPMPWHADLDVAADTGAPVADQDKEVANDKTQHGQRCS